MKHSRRRVVWMLTVGVALRPMPVAAGRSLPVDSCSLLVPEKRGYIKLVSLPSYSRDPESVSGG